MISDIRLYFHYYLCFNGLIYRYPNVPFTESEPLSSGILRGGSFFCRSHGGVGRTCEVEFYDIIPAMLLYKISVHPYVIVLS